MQNHMAAAEAAVQQAMEDDEYVRQVFPDRLLVSFPRGLHITM